MSGQVFNVERYAVHDGQGIRTLVFLKGCPLRCLWCANPEGQSLTPQLLHAAQQCIGCGACVVACPGAHLALTPQGLAIERTRCRQCGECVQECYPGALALDSRLMSVAEVMEEVRKDLAFYRRSGGGVTLSGGEPFAQPEFALALLRACQEAFIPTAVETCGHCSWDVLAAALKWVELVFYDIKHLDSPEHRQLTGWGNELILENLRRLAQCSVPVVVRVPVIPGCNDQPDHLQGIGRLVQELSSRWTVELLPYHGLGSGKYRKLGRDYRLAGTRAPSQEEMEKLRAVVRSVGVACRE